MQDVNKANGHPHPHQSCHTPRSFRTMPPQPPNRWRAELQAPAISPQKDHKKIQKDPELPQKDPKLHQKDPKSVRMTLVTLKNRLFSNCFPAKSPKNHPQPPHHDTYVTNDTSLRQIPKIVSPPKIPNSPQNRPKRAKR